MLTRALPSHVSDKRLGARTSENMFTLIGVLGQQLSHCLFDSKWVVVRIRFCPHIPVTLSQAFILPSLLLHHQQPHKARWPSLWHQEPPTTDIHSGTLCKALLPITHQLHRQISLRQLPIMSAHAPAPAPSIQEQWWCSATPECLLHSRSPNTQSRCQTCAAPYIANARHVTIATLPSSFAVDNSTHPAGSTTGQNRELYDDPFFGIIPVPTCGPRPDVSVQQSGNANQAQGNMNQFHGTMNQPQENMFQAQQDYNGQPHPFSANNAPQMQYGNFSSDT